MIGGDKMTDKKVCFKCKCNTFRVESYVDHYSGHRIYSFICVECGEGSRN